jgi:drug/metabolite transporter (DMT)-like permease
MGADYVSTSDREPDRLQHETRLIDPDPRGRKWEVETWALWVLGAIAGALLFALGLWVFGVILDESYSGWAYVVVAAIGAGVLASLLPYLAVERGDGDDEKIAEGYGPGAADAPVEGAEASDTGHVHER